MVTKNESEQAEQILNGSNYMLHPWVLAQLIDLKLGIPESGKCLGYIKLENGRMAEVFISTRVIPE